MVKNFSSVKRMFSCPFSACHWRRHSALVRRISFKAGVRRCSFDRRCARMCRSSLMRHDLIGSICSALGTWSSVSRADFGESAPILFYGFSSHTFQVSWPSPAFNTPKFLITFNCLIDEILRNFQWFQESETLRIWFSAFVKGNHSHAVFLETPLHVNIARDVSKLPWHEYLKGQWSKINQPLNLSASLSPAAYYMKFGT